MRRGVGAGEVLHAKMEFHAVLAHEDRAEQEYQDDRERNHEEHGGLLAGEARELHYESVPDDARAHFGSISGGFSRSVSPVSLRKTSSRSGFRTSRPRYRAPASLMAFSIFCTSSVCSTLTSTFLWLSRTGSKPIFRTISKAFSSTDCNVRTMYFALRSMSSPGGPMAMTFPFEMMATVSARSSASSI